MFDINRIRETIPHRYPMLLVDRIEEIREDGAVGIKNVSANEPFFQGHFPDFPVMPGVLVVEAMAQVGAVFLLSTEEGAQARLNNKVVLFASIDNARFRKPVFPGDQMRVEIKVLSRRSSASKVAGRATVNGRLVAEATLMCYVADRSSLSPQPNAAPSAASGAADSSDGSGG